MHFIKIFFRSHCTCESKGCKNLSVTAVSKLIIEEMKIRYCALLSSEGRTCGFVKYAINLLLINEHERVKLV